MPYLLYHRYGTDHWTCLSFYLTVIFVFELTYKLSFFGVEFSGDMILHMTRVRIYIVMRVSFSYLLKKPELSNYQCTRIFQTFIVIY